MDPRLGISLKDVIGLTEANAKNLAQINDMKAVTMDEVGESGLMDYNDMRIILMVEDDIVTAARFG